MVDCYYVYYPRGLKTGGPEALHQLVDSLRRQGQDAFLVPLPGSAQKERVPEYGLYDAPELSRVDDLERNAVIAPERALGPLRRIRRARRFAWWLSIDNSPAYWHVRRKQVAELRQTTSAFLGARGYLLRKSLRLMDMDHLSQSQYAWGFLAAHLGIAPSMVSDYTPPIENGLSAPVPAAERNRVVAFNPAKGGQLIASIRERYRGARFVAIEGMSRAEVVSTLSSSSVYLDLGHHPGKDRLPREAALCGAVTLVAMCGAAANSYDLPIPWEHKVSMGPSMTERAIGTLDNVLGNLQHEHGRQEGYRQQIRAERTVFDLEIKTALIEGNLGRDRILLSSP